MKWIEYWVLTAMLLSAAAAPAGEKGAADAARTDPGPVPGVVIKYLDPKTHDYIGSPSIAILGKGHYVAGHDVFGNGPQGKWTYVYESVDAGRTWRPLAEIKPQFWSSLFMHRGDLYVFGVGHNAIVIRRSKDGGKTWSDPRDGATGVLAKGRFH